MNKYTDIDNICDNYIKKTYDYYKYSKYDYNDYDDYDILIDYRNHNIKKYDNTEIINYYNDLTHELQDYLYDKIIMYVIKIGDLELIKVIHKQKYIWSIDHIIILIEYMINYTYCEIFKFMIDNGLQLNEDIFNCIINKYKYNTKEKPDYIYDEDNHDDIERDYVQRRIYIDWKHIHYIFQNILVECLDNIFNGLNNNFILHNGYVKDKYRIIFQYIVTDFNEDYFHKSRYDRTAVNENHIIISHIINKKYYIDNQLSDLIDDYIKDTINFYNNPNDRNGYYLRFMYRYDNDDNNEIFISLKNFMIKEEYYSDLTVLFNVNYKIYFNMMYNVMNNYICKDIFDHIIIDQIFNKKIFYMLCEDDLLFKLSLDKNHDIKILDIILDYYCYYINNNNNIDLYKVHKLLSIIINYIDNRLEILLDDKYSGIYKIKYFDRINYHIIKQKYYLNNEKLIEILKDVIENKSHRLYIKFLENIN